jgi:pilus assembly protein CpaE
MALLFLDHQPGPILSLSLRLSQDTKSSPVIVSRDRNPDRILQAMRAGAKDFAYFDDDSTDVLRVIDGLSRSLQAAAEPKNLAQIVVVFSCKGGSGSTIIATNLAGALRQDSGQTENRVALLDMDFQMGDVLTFLDLSSRYTWRDLIRDLHRLDEDLLDKSLTLHRAGVHVVAQSDAVEDADDIDPTQIDQAILFLRRYFDFLVVDGLRDFSERALSVLDIADRILLAMTQDIPAMKNAARCLALFRQLGYQRDKVKLVLNRYSKRGGLHPDAISDALGVSVDATVSNDFPTVIKAVNEGTLLFNAAPKAHVTRDIRGLTQLVGRKETRLHTSRKLGR